MASIRNHRVSANTVAGGITAYSAVGSLVPPIFRALGFFEMAAGIDWQWVLYAQDNLNWPAIHTLFFFMGAVALIVFNADLALRNVKKWRDGRKRIWNATARDAIYHICYRSFFGTGKPTKEGFSSSVEAFNQAMRGGELRLKGRKSGAAFAVKIPKKNQRSLSLDPKTVDEQMTGTGGKLINNDNAVEYEGVLVDIRQVERLWPENTRPTSWMAE